MPDGKGERPIDFKSLIDSYCKMQCRVVCLINSLAKDTCHATPGQFLLAQFKMSQMSQIGESISNLFALANSVILHAIQNIRAQ